MTRLEVTIKGRKGLTLTPAIRIRHHEGEPAWSVLYRLAARHRASTVNEFLRQVGYNHELKLAVLNGSEFSKVADFSGKDIASLAHWTIRPAESGGRMLCNEVVTRAGTSKWKFVRVCPLCLRDDRLREDGHTAARAWRRSWWNVQQIEHCMEHNVQLLAQCPECGKPPLSSLPDLATCRCGLDLSRVGRDTVDPASLEGERYLFGRLGAGMRIQHAVLDQLSFVSASEVMLHVGRAWTWRGLHEGARTAGQKACERSSSLAVLDEGFVGFVSLLGELSGDGLKVKGSVHAAYHRLDIQMKKRGEAEWGIVYRAFKDHLMNYVVGNKIKRTANEDSGHKMLTSPASLAIRLSCSMIRLNHAALLAGVISAPAKLVQNSKLSPNDAERIAKVVNGYVSGWEATPALGIQHSTLVRLLKAGVIKTVPLLSPRGRLYPKVAIRRAIEALSPRRLTPVTNPGTMITLDQARIATGCRETVLLQAVLEKRILVRGRLAGRKGASSALVDLSEVRQGLESISCQLLTPRQGAELLGLRAKGLRGAIRSGLLGVSSHPLFKSEPGRPRPIWVNRSSLDEFSDKYATPAQVLSAISRDVLQRRLPSLLRSLRRFEIVPVLKANGATFYQSLTQKPIIARVA